MKIHKLFSKRQKQLRGEVPDVYQYKTIPLGITGSGYSISGKIFGEKSGQLMKSLQDSS